MEAEATTGAAADPATMAFDELKAEVKTLRLAVQQLAAVPLALDIPDYTDSLAELRQGMVSLVKHYRELCETPVLAVTPDKLALQIAAASASARREEQTALGKATSDNTALSRELSRYLEKARTAHEQWKWLLWTGGLSFIAGVMLMGSIWSIYDKRVQVDSSPIVEKSDHRASKQ
jgi:hypothetical protein